MSGSLSGSCGRLAAGRWLQPLAMLVLVVICTPTALAQDAEESQAAPQEKPLPTFEVASNSVRRDFVALSYYKPGDVISKSEVDQALEHLRLLGWSVSDAKEVLAKIPGDKEFLIRQLRSEKGFKFMRSISKWPSAYDRLDRLTGLANGRQILIDLINDRGGHELVDYLINTDGGAAMGQMLSQTPGGGDFKKPTGKIYTVDQLIERLKESYAKTLELRKQQAEENDQP